MNETWVVIIISLPVVFLFAAIVFVIWQNWDEIKGDSIKRIQDDINRAVPYESKAEAKNDIIRTIAKPAIMYCTYFLIVIPLLVGINGGITYGPNSPYTVFLIVVGIPFIACFNQLFMKTDNLRNRMIRSSFSDMPDKQSILPWVVAILVFYLFYIKFLFKISNSLLAG